MKVHSVDFELDKRGRILDAAAQLIVQNGLESPMSAIAARAGVATGSLYNYFKSKNEMIAAVYARLADEIADAIVAEIDRSLSHRERLMRYVNAYIDFFWADPGRAILFEYLANVPLIPPTQLGPVFDRVTQYGQTLIIEAKADGALKNMDPALMGAMIGGGIRNCLKWRRIEPRPLSDDERRQIAELCWNAIAASPSSFIDS
ncbi:MAG: TetR/AcrR family transcriptional regulator [Devosia sp.]|nr:TetR/AcrR family transcriptional regulator [Devosia sp.]